MPIQISHQPSPTTLPLFNDVEHGSATPMPMAKGAFLTWKDLTVSVQSDGHCQRLILDGVSGYAEPGKVLAVMGPSGCGKSTLLDALTDRLRSGGKKTGEVRINGRKRKLACGTSAYVTQDDTLMGTLTAKEAVFYSAQLQLPDSMSRLEKKERAETTLHEMGLQDAMDMRIGGWGSKGLSGGQKRRVSICIEILKRPKLLFLDEPTSGLDSAASYHVMSHLMKLAKLEGTTVVATIHQPSGDVFELFHNLCLLSCGKTVFFGAVSSAEQFFAENGFPCPNLRNPPDHYLRTINKDFNLEDESHTAEEAINLLVESYASSTLYQNTIMQINSISRNQENGDQKFKKKEDRASFITQCSVLTRRSFVNMYRDLGYYWLRFAIYIALCLCLGTLFYDIGYSYGSIQARGGMLMFIATLLTFMAIGGFPSFVEEMKIFGRERLNGHYKVEAFVIGNTLSSLPYLLVVSIIPGSIAYFLPGLQRTYSHFIFYSLLLLVCMLLVESLMMVVASVVPNFLMGIITGAGIQGIMMLNAGFFRLPKDLPKVLWRYPMFFISFHRYALQGLFKNEFKGLSFPNMEGGWPAKISGEFVLEFVWQVDGNSKWVDVCILIGMAILYRLLFLLIIKFIEKVKPTYKY